MAQALGVDYAGMNGTGQLLPTENNDWDLVIKGLLLFKQISSTFTEHLLCARNTV